ncbi:MAG: RibD family protein, partial [Pseudonocardia sp.]
AGRPGGGAVPGPAPLAGVALVRAGVDAILVGPGTIRADDPRLLVRSAARRADRVARGLPPNPTKVTITRSGGLDPRAAFFTTGEGEKLVYAASGVRAQVAHRLAGVATVVDVGDPPALPAVLADLAARGVARLMVEGGTAMHTLFLAARLVDELHVAVAPLFVGDPRAPRFVGTGVFPRLRLVAVEQVGDVALLTYRP